MADTKSGGYVVKGAEGIFKLAASFAPVPGLAPAVDLLFAILIVFDNVRTNKCVVCPAPSHRHQADVILIFLGKKHIYSDNVAMSSRSPSIIRARPGRTTRPMSIHWSRSWKRALTVPPSFSSRRYLMCYFSTLDKIMERAAKWQKASFFNAIINFNATKDDIEASHKEIDRMLETFHVSTIPTAITYNSSC
jgi:hypothetical protein